MVYFGRGCGIGCVVVRKRFCGRPSIGGVGDLGGVEVGAFSLEKGVAIGPNFDAVERVNPINQNRISNEATCGVGASYNIPTFAKVVGYAAVVA